MWRIYEISGLICQGKSFFWVNWGWKNENNILKLSGISCSNGPSVELRRFESRGLQGRPQVGGGGLPFTTETEKNCCWKMVLFSRDIYNDKGPGRWDRKWIKNQFSIEILICKFQNFLNKFQSPLVFSENAQKFAARFLKFF